MNKKDQAGYTLPSTDGKKYAIAHFGCLREHKPSADKRKAVELALCGGLLLGADLWEEEGYLFLTEATRTLIADEILSLIEPKVLPDRALTVFAKRCLGENYGTVRQVLQAVSQATIEGE